jgi:hypothetical protein
VDCDNNQLRVICEIYKMSARVRFACENQITQPTPVITDEIVTERNA